MDAIRTLQQPTAWDPLDLTAENIPAIPESANDGVGFLPDLTDTRPELRAVGGPDSGPSTKAPQAPWEE